MGPLNRNLVVIGASAGGVTALAALLRGIDEELPATVLIVVHSSSEGTSFLPSILRRTSSLPVEFVRDGMPLVPRMVFVGPRDHHVVIEHGRMRVSRGAKEHGFRPAIDPLFRSAAIEMGPRVIGGLLSGGGSDGMRGLELIKLHGGIAVVQDPSEAMVATMPLSAIRSVEIDHVASAHDLGGLIAKLTREPLLKVNAVAAQGPLGPEETGAVPGGPPVAITCPECGGVLWELSKTGTTVFRCHVGHAFSAESLLESQSQSVERVLWSAVRLFRERAALQYRMAKRSRDVELGSLAERYEAQALDSERNADLIEGVVTRGESGLLFGSARDVMTEIPPEGDRLAHETEEGD